jgi:hypothetical protein
MDEELARYARFGGAGTTNLNPLILIWVLLAVLLILLLPRKYVVVPFFLTALPIPLGQALVIGGVHFSMFRIVVIFGMCRVLWSSIGRSTSSRRMHFNSIDKTFFWYVIASVITFTLLFSESQAFVNRLGFALDSLGTYFFLRLLFDDDSVVDRAIQVLAVVCALVALSMMNEQATGRNLFSIFGGVPEFTNVREGALRSQGPFAHAILAGVFGATTIALFIRLWWRRSSRTFAVLGLISSGIIMLTSKSSTPLATGMAAVVVLCMWPLRNRMRLLRWGIVCTLIGLHIVMKAPVWSLIGRFGAIGGSSGYHRYILIDNFIHRFSEWWLVGVRDTTHWGYDMWDVSNQYVATGVSGGLVTFVLFIAVITYCFKGLGRARKEAEIAGDRERALGFWALGAAFFANLVAFFGITYFDQSQIAWYALLAMIGALTFSPDSARLYAPQVEHPVPIQAVATPDRGLIREWNSIGTEPHLSRSSARKPQTQRPKTFEGKTPERL